MPPADSGLPDFKLGDPATTRLIEIKHLVYACTGLPRQDMEWLFRFKSYTPASTFTLLSTMLDASLGPWSYSSA